MHFCHSDISADESDTGNAFELPPTAGAKLPVKPHDVPDPAAHRYRLNLFDFAQELKVHIEILSCASGFVNVFGWGEGAAVVVGRVYVGKDGGSRDGQLKDVVGVRLKETAEAGVIERGQDFIAVQC